MISLAVPLAKMPTGSNPLDKDDATSIVEPLGTTLQWLGGMSSEVSLKCVKNDGRT